MGATTSWYITFGIGTPNGQTYTEVRVPADLSFADQAAAVRHAAVERYGRRWAFDYSPEMYELAIERYGLTLREVVTA